MELLKKPGDREQLAGLGILRQMVAEKTASASSDPKAAARRATKGCLAAAELLNANGISVEVRKTCLATLLDAAEPAFANELADPDFGELSRAAAAKTAVAALAKFLDGSHSDEEPQRKAFLAIGAIGGPAGDVLIAYLGSKDVSVRRDAISTLATMRAIAGLKAEPAVAALVARLGDENVSVRLLAPVALARWGADAVAPTVAALASDNAKVRAGAADALGRLGAVATKTSPEVADKLVGLLADKDDAVRGTAAWAIGRLGSAAVDRPAVAAALQARFDDAKETALVRGNAARSLAESTQPGATLVSRLGESLADPKLADAAADALATIGARIYGAEGEK
jgi:HEAT repeat protein